MAIIDPDGLFQGDRLVRCSDKARYLWPYLFTASNSLGRIELNYRKLYALIFSTFENPVTEDDFLDVIAEYHENFLLFLYRADGVVWGQWDTDKRFLPNYQSVKDKSSPAPPEKEFVEFRSTYKSSKKLPEVLDKISLGVGVGVGFGVGIGVGESEDEMDFQKHKNADRALVELSNEILKKAEEKATFRPQLRALLGVHDRDTVVEAFKAWAYAQPQPFPYKNPISAFLRVAGKLIDEGVGEAPTERAGVSQQEIVHLLDNIALHSDNNVVFSTGQKLVVIRMANEYGVEDTLAGFKDFYGRIPEDSKNWAAKEFTEKGEQFVRTKRALRAKAAAQQAFLTEQADLQSKAAQEEIDAQLAADDADQSSSEIL